MRTEYEVVMHKSLPSLLFQSATGEEMGEEGVRPALMDERSHSHQLVQSEFHLSLLFRSPWDCSLERGGQCSHHSKE